MFFPGKVVPFGGIIFDEFSCVVNGFFIVYDISLLFGRKMNGNKKCFVVLIFVSLIIIFLASFELYHSDRVLEIDDNCPIGIFEKTSVLFFDNSFVILLLVLFFIILKVKILNQLLETQTIKSNKSKRAPPIKSVL